MTVSFLFIGLALFLYMSGWFIFSLYKKRNDVADTAWGIGFIFASLIAFFLSEAPGWRGALSTTLVTIWGTRLAWHIHRRNRNKPEDYRYQAWRKAWGQWFFLRSYGQVFLLQGLLLFCIVSPVLLVNLQPSGAFSLLDGIGLGVWTLGFLFETIGDRQLASFIAEPTNSGKLLQSGLWRYSRHPNYFGEVAQWWGLWLLAMNVSYGWFALLGPLTITCLILKVSGIPLLEAKMAGHPDFPSYARRTSIFIPWFPKTYRDGSQR